MSSLSRSKFARICVEIDISKPLKQGFWVGDDDHRVFIVILYEKLPIFCYLCGMAGHGSNNCSRRSSVVHSYSSSPPSQVPLDQNWLEARVAMETLDDGMEAMLDHPTPVPNVPCAGDDVSNFGPWMLVTRQRGRGGGRGSIGGGAGRPASRAMHASSTTPSNVSPNVQTQSDPLRLPRGSTLFRGKGGHIGNRSRASDILTV